MNRWLVALPLVAVLAGCGGGASVGSAKDCLRKAGAEVRENQVTKTFEQTGVEHALVATFPGNQAVLLLFAKNGILANQAENQLRAMVAQLSGGNVTGELPIRRKENVLVSWLSPPTEANDGAVDACL